MNADVDPVATEVRAAQTGGNSELALRKPVVAVRQHLPLLLVNGRPAPPDGPAQVGLSCLIASSTGLGLVLLGTISANTLIPIMVISSGGLLITAVFYSLKHVHLPSLLFVSAGGFTGTYALLQLASINRWLGISQTQLPIDVSAFLATWLFIYSVLAFAIQPKRLTTTALLAAFAAGLGVMLVANLINSLGLLEWAAAPIFFVSVISAYLLIEVWWGSLQRSQARLAVGVRTAEERKPSE